MVKKPYVLTFSAGVAFTGLAGLLCVNRAAVIAQQDDVPVQQVQAQVPNNARAQDGENVNLDAPADIPADIPANVQGVLDTYCIDCHGPEQQKGDIRLDTLASMEGDDRLSLLNKAHAALHFEEMPPEDKDQPTDAQRDLLTGWLGEQLAEASTLAERMRQPGMGNYVNHEDLFSGEYTDLPASTPARRWLISPYIFDARFNQILSIQPFRTIDGTRHYVVGDNSRSNQNVSLTNPFQLPVIDGVRYFSTESFNGGHLLTMLGNAESAAKRLMELTQRARGRDLPAVHDLMAMQWDQEQRLAAREAFLNNFIDRLLREAYADRHEQLLPEFVPLELEPIVGEQQLVRIGAASPGRDEERIIYHTVLHVQQEGDTDEQLIDKCQYEWFIAGVDERRIRGRMTFMRDYLPQLREMYADERHISRNRLPEYRPLEESEMAAVMEALLQNRAADDFYDEVIDRCIEQWRQGFELERIAAGLPEEQEVAALVDEVFVRILERSPNEEEAPRYAAQLLGAMQSMDREQAILQLMQTLMLRSDFVYRYEIGGGEPDEYGRRMLSPRELSYAIAYALTDSSPDEELVQAVQEGRLSTREDVLREVERMLANRDQWYIIDEDVDRLAGTDSLTNMPVRELRFFRDFFGYPSLLDIFKDNKRFGGNYDLSRGRLVEEADMLIAHILEEDQDVFNQLLTTEDFFVFHSGDDEVMAAASDNLRAIYDRFRELDWQNFDMQELETHGEFLDEHGVRITVRGGLNEFKKYMGSVVNRFEEGQSYVAPYYWHNYFGPHVRTIAGQGMRGEEVIKFFNIDMGNWDFPVQQPTPIPNRRGMLTHPAWLIAHAQNTETDPVRRGLWVRHMLLAGTVPDVPITVDAVIPEDHTRTLRDRLADRTQQPECWRCHVQMNPLGITFEVYDDFGRYRTEESLEHPDNLIETGPANGTPSVDLRDIYRTLPVDSTGNLVGTGNPDLDGEVTDAIDLIGRLSRSERVRQSIIRHAFRYFMGRNETLADSSTLIAADQAYVASGGSFDAVIVSLLTSDSFIYRVDPEE